MVTQREHIVCKYVDRAFLSIMGRARLREETTLPPISDQRRRMLNGMMERTRRELSESFDREIFESMSQQVSMGSNFQDPLRVTDTYHLSREQLGLDSRELTVAGIRQTMNQLEEMEQSREHISAETLAEAIGIDLEEIRARMRAEGQGPSLTEPATEVTDDVDLAFSRMGILEPYQRAIFRAMGRPLNYHNIAALMTVVPLDPMYPVPVRSPTQLELNVGLIVDPSLHPLVTMETIGNPNSVVDHQTLTLLAAPQMYNAGDTRGPLPPAVLNYWEDSRRR